LFAFTHHAFSRFTRIFERNLSRFLPVEQLLQFLFICTMFNAFFLPTPVPRSLENVCLNRISKRDKKLGDSWAWGVLFLPFGKEERRIKFHIFIAWTHKVCASKKRRKKNLGKAIFRRSGELKLQNFPQGAPTMVAPRRH
jgi:hypothetical protein